MNGRVFWLFRSNLAQLEPYHKCLNDQDLFIKNCYDFYLLMGLSFLKQNFFDRVVIWRLKPKVSDCEETYSYNVYNNKTFEQKFVPSFKECLYAEKKPNVSLFRGGFPEYDEIIRINRNAFGKRVYLGAGKRANPNDSSLYDLVMYEDERDSFFKPFKHSLFYKTASSNFFYPLIGNKATCDILWICNFSQIRQKGQEYFMNLVAKSKYLRSLKIKHIGNLSFRGKELAAKYQLTNIEFLDYKDRKEINQELNHTKAAIVTSNQEDGSPRVITEVLCSGTPLLVRNCTRCLDFYKKLPGVFTFNEKNIETLTQQVLADYCQLKEKMSSLHRNELSIDNISNLNFFNMI